MISNQKTGSFGESVASNYLLKHGYKILARNERTKFGEIDIIAKKDMRIFFVEVKTRISLAKGKPYEAITPLKLRHLFRAIQYYVLKNHLNTYKLAISVMSIQLRTNREVDRIDFFEDVGGYHL